MEKIKVLIIPRDREIKNTHRIVKPHLYLQEKFGDDFFVDIDFEPNFEDLEYLKQYQIIVYHEYLDIATINKFKELGIVGILDIDDNWSINKNYPFYKYIKHQEEAIKEVIRNSEYITTSTKPMYEKIKSVAPNAEVVILPDGIDSEDRQYNFPTTNELSDRLRFGFIGDDYSIEDIKILKGVVSKLKSDKLLDKMQVVLCGFNIDSYKTVTNPTTGEKERIKKDPKETVWYEYERILTNDYTTISDAYRKHLLEFKETEFPGVENEPYRRVWARPTKIYGSYYSEFDVTLAPMDTNSYNITRSPFKAMESGFYKKPIIAQDYGVYSDILTNSLLKGGVIDIESDSILIETRKNHKDWHKAMKKLIQEKSVVVELGRNLYQVVKVRYDLNNITKLRKGFYETVVKTIQ